jgi:hypothetical protein
MIYFPSIEFIEISAAYRDLWLIPFENPGLNLAKARFGDLVAANSFAKA